MNNDKFVFVKNDLQINGVIVIQKNEIGFVKQDNGKSLLVYFIVGNKIFDIERELVEYFDPLQTGDLFPKKVCNVCHKLLDTENFSKNQNGINNRPIRRPSCDDCRKDIDGVNMSNGDRIKWNKEKPYLIPFECPICKKRTIPGLTSKVVLDHDHGTGKVRGWICDSCNTGIGRFKDDVELLKSAIQFLETN
jgi:uncharacterized protein YlaI